MTERPIVIACPKCGELSFSFEEYAKHRAAEGIREGAKKLVIGP